MSLLENIYRERLVVGCEKAFQEFSPDKAAEIRTEYAAATETQDFAFVSTTLSRSGMLLVRFIAPEATRCAGGHHSLGLWDDRFRKVNYLKTLLLVAPSISVPDQAYMLAAEMAIQEADSQRAKELRSRWLAYIDYISRRDSAAYRPGCGQDHF